MLRNMDELYPRGPGEVPADLTRPSRAYTRHTWASVLGLLGFAALYLGMIAWFARTAFRLASGVFGDRGGFVGVLFAVPALFLLAFLVKGLFYVRRSQRPDVVQVTAAEEPQLFAFVHRIADEAGARRPHKVFLTPEVNAAVAYDVSFWNLVFPSRKNLYIGLGLVNLLTLDEMKAVLAHEFGHFAQRTMAVGTWVYVAQQAVSAIVARRDGFDTFLNGLSRVDLRIAWIGWLGRLVVWSIRSVLDTAFRGLVVLQRGLSREMEFQADLIAVSLTGSDSIVHALHRLAAGDEALDRADAFAAAEARAERPVADLYALQTRCLAGIRDLRNDPGFGTVPPLPAVDPARHRVFDAHFAETPRMWATHPPSRDREENAKRRYVGSVLDPRPAWSLFRDPEATRRSMTAQMLARTLPDAAKHPPAPLEDSLGRLSAQFARHASDARYRGVYVGRPAARNEHELAACYGPLPAPEAIGAALDALYPPSLVDTLRTFREADGQVDQLEALRKGALQAAGGVLRFRGRAVPRRELPALVESVRAERDGVAATLNAHARAVRTAHRAAARALDPAWETHLVALLKLVHSAEHLAADLADAKGFLDNTFHVVTADGKVGASEMKRLEAAAQDLYEALQRTYTHGAALRPPDPADPAFADAEWPTIFAETFKLNPPSREAMAGNWFPAMQTWVNAGLSGLSDAADTGLNALLAAEDHVARCFREGTPPGEAPRPARVPDRYATLVPGTERKRQERLGLWDRFLLADGWGPGAVRLGVAGAVLAPGFLLTGKVGESTLVIHNGLAGSITTEIGDRSLVLGPGEDRRLGIVPGVFPVRTRQTVGDEPIEAFEADADQPWTTFVYNVAGADAFTLVTIPYGDVATPPPAGQGGRVWFTSPADFTLTDPPSSVESDGPTTRTLLVAVGPYGPGAVREASPDEASFLTIAAGHVRLDPTSAPDWTTWATTLDAMGGDARTIVSARAAAHPEDVVLGRAEQNLEVPDVCTRHHARAAALPDDPGAAYLDARCREKGGETGAVAALRARFPDYPWVRWALAWDAFVARDWDTAEPLLRGLSDELPSMTDEVGQLTLATLRMRGSATDAQIRELPAFDRSLRSELLLAEGDANWRPAPADRASDADAQLALAGGRVAEAWRAVETDRTSALTWLIAASEGAPTETHAAVWGLSLEDTIRVDTAVPALALARGPEDTTAVFAALHAAPEVFETPLRPAIDATTPAEVVAAIDQACTSTPSPFLCARFRLYGVLRLGEAAPPAWRTEVRALLLPWERPWIAPDPTDPG